MCLATDASALARHPHVIATPQIGIHSEASEPGGEDIAYEVLAALEGEPL
jgi:phosphoglycerate dehydrogenase-like enzyme